MLTKKKSAQQVIDESVNNNTLVSGSASSIHVRGCYSMLLGGEVVVNGQQVNLTQLDWGSIYDRISNYLQTIISTKLRQREESRLWAIAHDRLRNEFAGKMDDVKIVALTNLAVSKLVSEVYVDRSERAA